MSSEEQAAAYLAEARYTLASAEAIFEAARSSRETLWAQVVKNAYDAIEQAISAAIASRGERVPRDHPAKVTTFLDLFEPEPSLEDLLLGWLRRRSDSQYVDIRGDEINVPHEQFGRDDADRILEDAASIIQLVARILEEP